MVDSKHTLYTENCEILSIHPSAQRSMIVNAVLRHTKGKVMYDKYWVTYPSEIKQVSEEALPRLMNTLSSTYMIYRDQMQICSESFYTSKEYMISKLLDCMYVKHVQWADCGSDLVSDAFYNEELEYVKLSEFANACVASGFHVTDILPKNALEEFCRYRIVSYLLCNGSMCAYGLLCDSTDMQVKEMAPLFDFQDAFLEVQAKYSMISKTAEVLWCLNNTEFFLYQNPAEDMLPYKDDFQEFNRRVCALKIPTLYTWEKRILSKRDKVGLDMDILKITKLLLNADLDDEALECAMKEML